MAVTLVQETGAGVAGANAYSTAAAVTAHWDNQPQSAFSTAWTSASSDEKEGAIIEATQYLDGYFGPYYKGTRAGYVQGLLWPRTGAYTDTGVPLPTLPPELIKATAELAGRAVSARLSVDSNIDGIVTSTRKKAGPTEVETDYSSVTSTEKKYGVVAGTLAPILNGQQPNAPSMGWAWA